MTRLLHTEPLNNVIARLAEKNQELYNQSQAHVLLEKAGGTPITRHALSGELYASKSGWILLDVPNALVRGAFDALSEQGAELPPSEGNLNAHISVMNKDDVETIGGVDKITERGHHFHYTLGPVQEVSPDNWDGMSKVWFIQVKSKELQDLRKSYGLSPTPNDGEHNFHITIAVRRKNVLRNNDTAKTAAIEKEALPHGALAAAAVLSHRLPGGNSPVLDEDALLANKIENDTSYIDSIQNLPTNLKKPRRTVPPALRALLQQNTLQRKSRGIVDTAIAQPNDLLDSLLKKGNNYGLLETNATKENTGNEETRARYIGGRSEIERTSTVHSKSAACTKTSAQSDEEAHIDAIIAYYNRNT